MEAKHQQIRIKKDVPELRLKKGAIGRITSYRGAVALAKMGLRVVALLSDEYEEVSPDPHQKEKKIP